MPLWWLSLILQDLEDQLETIVSSLGLADFVPRMQALVLSRVLESAL